MIKNVKQLFESNEAVGGLYVGLIGAVLAELLPSPTDPIDFWLERKWRMQLEKGEITPKEYWGRITKKYYLLDSSWWTIVLMTAVLVKGDIKRKATIVGAVVGGGIVIGVIGKNIRKDVSYFEKYVLVKREDAKKFGLTTNGFNEKITIKK